MVSVPTPEVLDEKSTFLPLLVTVTASTLLTWMAMLSVTVYVWDQAPVRLSATTLLPSTVTSTQDASPEARLTWTTVRSGVAAASAWAWSPEAASPVAVEPEPEATEAAWSCLESDADDEASEPEPDPCEESCPEP